MAQNYKRLILISEAKVLIYEIGVQIELPAEMLVELWDAADKEIVTESESDNLTDVIEEIICRYAAYQP
jgi:hypothetical protein